MFFIQVTDKGGVVLDYNIFRFLRMHWSVQVYLIKRITQVSLLECLDVMFVAICFSRGAQLRRAAGEHV